MNSLIYNTTKVKYLLNFNLSNVSELDGTKVGSIALDRAVMYSTQQAQNRDAGIMMITKIGIKCFDVPFKISTFQAAGQITTTNSRQPHSLSFHPSIHHQVMPLLPVHHH